MSIKAIRRLGPAFALVLFLTACSAPQATPSPVRPTSSHEARIYILEIEELSFTLQDSSSELGRLVTGLRAQDEQWAEKMVAHLESIDRADCYVQAIDPPDELLEPHDRFLAACADVYTAAEIIAQTGGRLDEGEVEQVNALFDRGRTRMGEVKESLHTYLRQHD